MIEIYFPTSRGEWLAFASAGATILYGLWVALALLFARRDATHAGTRAQLAGFLCGTGAACILMAQPLLYLALGGGWALAVLFGLLAMVRHGRAGWRGPAATIAGAGLAAMPLGYVFGVI